MLILLTTANFPNVMLPAYNSARSNSIFFLVFLVFGLYFLLNVLLAIVFDNYKKRIEDTVLEKQNERHKYIEMYYRCYDQEEKGYLTINESKKFLALVMNLDYTNA
jgi:two pore calcium channel protein